MSDQVAMRQNQRVTGKEQYYTPPEIAELCIDILDELCLGEKYLEPAGGTGAFVQALLERKREVISFDIEPKHPHVAKTEDFLEEDLAKIGSVITITNPPFGRANKLSVRFFNKCADVSSYIAFLVPKSWRKWSLINRLDRRFHLISDTDLTVDFIHEYDKKSSGKLNTIFQVWEKREYFRKKFTVEDRGFIEKTTPDLADLCMTVYGRGCGQVTTNFPRRPNTTKMFLRIHHGWVYDALSAIDFSIFYRNTAFVESLAIDEINFLLNEYADRQLRRAT